MTRYQILGITDEVNACDCCGKSNLKSTVALREIDTGADFYFGVVCAAKAGKATVKEVNAGVRAAEAAKAAARAEADRVAREAWMDRWVAHLNTKTGGMVDFSGQPDIFNMIRKLGGMTAASVGFAG